ncbi:MAG: hypothetical protein PVI57_18240 [Gemmatimonadota bacterium]
MKIRAVRAGLERSGAERGREGGVERGGDHRIGHAGISVRIAISKRYSRPHRVKIKGLWQGHDAGPAEILDPFGERVPAAAFPLRIEGSRPSLEPFP